MAGQGVVRSAISASIHSTARRIEPPPAKSRLRVAVTSGPSAWRRSELTNDTRWILPLSKAAIAGLNRALAHAKACGKPMLGMSPEDFPLTGAALDELRLATDATQRGFGLCLLRGLPDDARCVEVGLASA